MTITTSNNENLDKPNLEDNSLHIESKHWEKLLELEKQIDLDNENIKNNFATLKAINRLKKVQTKELKDLLKNKKLSHDEFLEHKQIINEEAKKSKEDVMQQLAYNTTFITQKYQELTELQKHTRIKEINKELNQENKKLNHDIKDNKRKTKSEYKKIVHISQKNGVNKQQIHDLKAEYRQEFLQKNRLKIDRSEKVEQGFIKSTKSTTYQALTITILVSVPVLILVGLLLNYLVYIPRVMQWDKFEFNNQTIPGFAISMIMIVITLIFTSFVVSKTTKRIVIDRKTNTAKITSIGFISSFFDILGVGSFATSMGLIKATKSIKDDKLLPGTLNMAFATPILMEGTFLVGAVDTNVVTLVVLVICAVIGSYIGASVVNVFNAKTIKLIISIALFIAGIVMILTTPQVSVIASGTAKGLSGWKWVIGILGFLLIGVLMSFGVGSYAPSILILSLLGLGLIYIAPIMMCTSAFLMPVTSYKFYKDNNYLPKTSLTMMIGGIFGATTAFIFFYVLIQGFGVMDRSGVAWQSLIKWLTIAVMFYSSITMFIEYLGLVKHDKKHLNEKPKKLKRKSLTKFKNHDNLNEEIKNQYSDTVGFYNDDNLNTETVVKKEKIPVKSWFKNKKHNKSVKNTKSDKNKKKIK